MKYSEKIKKLLENNSIDLKILLEEDEDKKEEKDKKEDSEEEEDLSSMFDSLDKDDEEESDEEISPSVDKDEDSFIDQPSYDELNKQIGNATNNLASRLNKIESDLSDYLAPSSDLRTSNIETNNNNPYNKEEDIFESLTKDNDYFKNSIKDFILEKKENKDQVSEEDFDELEEKIKRLEKLTDLIDRKFNNPLKVVTFEDVDKVVENAIYLIKTCDPVKYAYDETLKYLAIKSEKKEEESIEEEFSLKFNEACKEEGYDASSITNIAIEKNDNFKNSVNNTSGSS
jgi:hypothetical protein